MTMLMQKRQPDFNWEGMMNWWSAHSDGSHSPPVSEEEIWEEDDDDDDRGDDVGIIDVVQRVHGIGMFFNEHLQRTHPPERIDDEIALWLSLLLELQELAEYVDITKELHIGKYLAPFFHKVLCYKHDTSIYNKHAVVRAKAAEVVTTMVENNPSSQQLVMEINGLQPLLDNFISDPDATARTKALVAISALIRNNKPGITAFQLDNGYEALRDALSSESVTVQREALNRIQYLLHENSSDCNIFTQLGFPCIIMHLTSSDDAQVREAALRGLLVLTRDEGGQMVRNDDKLKQVLRVRIEGISAMAPEDLGSAREEIQLVDSLWNACYNEPSSLGEKGLLVFPALRDALSSESVTLQREALNLIQYLLHEKSSDWNIVIELGLQEADIMVHLTSSDDAEVREAVLRCLLVLARDESGHNGPLVKNDDKLKQVLRERIEGISAMAPEDLGAAREEIQLVDSLWNACYNEPSSLGEKGLLVLPGEDAPAPFFDASASSLPYLAHSVTKLQQVLLLASKFSGPVGLVSIMKHLLVDSLLLP